jgi:uncharacterized protein
MTLMDHTTLAVEAKDTAGKMARPTPQPADHTITVRDLRFGRNVTPARWWLNHDPIATAWHNALSATFPRGETFFIESVKAHRDGASPQLSAEIRQFIAQEINHTREHIAFNKAAVDAGYDLSRIDAHVAEMLEMTKGRPPIVNLAATMALEHYTAIMANQFLANPQHFAGGEPQVTAMWRWHAIEEIEHKAVAFDTYLHATQHWGKWQQWRLRCLMMLIVSREFLTHRIVDTLDLLAQDGLKGWKIKAKLAAYLLWQPGILRHILPGWLAYFRPSFHPWDHDDRHLLAAAGELPKTA